MKKSSPARAESKLISVLGQLGIEAAKKEMQYRILRWRPKPGPMK